MSIEQSCLRNQQLSSITVKPVMFIHCGADSKPITRSLAHSDVHRQVDAVTNVFFEGQ